MAKHASISQTLSAFEALTDGELLGLRRAATTLMQGTQFSEPTDLIYEALTRCLDGRRNWPLSAPFASFMLNAMRSIASGERQFYRARYGLDESTLEEELFEMGAVAPSAEQDALAAESARFARARAEELRGSFDGDPIARAVMDGWLRELTAAELMAKHKLSPKEYDAARKRVERQAATIARRYQ